MFQHRLAHDRNSAGSELSQIGGELRKRPLDGATSARPPARFRHSPINWKLGGMDWGDAPIASID